MKECNETSTVSLERSTLAGLLWSDIAVEIYCDAPNITTYKSQSQTALNPSTVEPRLSEQLGTLRRSDKSRIRISEMLHCHVVLASAPGFSSMQYGCGAHG